MTREVETGTVVIDQFPAFESDGVSKRAGLLAADFDTTVYRDGDVVALPVTISPAFGDPGEYKTQFTPSADGFYELHVRVLFSGDIRFARYESVPELTRDVAADTRDGLIPISSGIASVQVNLSRILGLLHRNAILDKQQYDQFTQLTYARLRVFDSPANVPATPDGNETVGLLHEYELETEYDGLNVVRKFSLKQIL